jgi:hypothetical protein
MDFERQKMEASMNPMGGMMGQPAPQPMAQPAQQAQPAQAPLPVNQAGGMQ